MVRLRTGLVIALVLFQSPAFAAYVTGSQLRQQCAAMSRDGSYRVADGLVGGYVAGVADQVAGEGGGRRHHCAAGAPLTKLRDAVCGWAGRHPEARAENGAALVRQALRDRFPCSSGR